MTGKIYFFSGQCFSWVYEVDVYFTLLTKNWQSWQIVDKVDENDENDEIYEVDIFSSYFF